MKTLQRMLVVLLLINTTNLGAQIQATADDGSIEVAQKDSTRKRSLQLPPIPTIQKKALSYEDSIAQINHHASRYIFAPSAYPINKGSFYYQNYDVLLNDVQMGITDQLGVGIGYAFPLFMYLTPKYSMPIRKKHTLAVGDIAGFSVFTGTDNMMWLNTFYGMYTLGSPQNNVSLGLGMLRSSEADGSLAVTNVSGMYSITPNFYFVGEAWFNNRNRKFVSGYDDCHAQTQYPVYLGPVSHHRTQTAHHRVVLRRIELLGARRSIYLHRQPARLGCQYRTNELSAANQHHRTQKYLPVYPVFYLREKDWGYE
jgi:hypothetical protein